MIPQIKNDIDCQYFNGCNHREVLLASMAIQEQEQTILWMSITSAISSPLVIT